MLRLKIFVAAFLLITTILNGSSGKLDSLASLADVYEGAERARILVRLANEYIKYSDFISAENYADEAYSIFYRYNDRIGITDAMNAKASAYIIRRNVDSVFHYSKIAYKISDSLNYLKGKGYALNNLGLGNVYVGEVEKADSLLTESGIILEALNNRSDYASNLMNRGISAMYSGRSQEAVELYDEAAVIYREEGDSINYANALLNVGSLCVNVLGEYNRAIEATLKAQRIYEELNNSARLAYCKMILGSVYEFTNRIPEAINNYKEAIKIHSENNNLHMKGVTLNYIGESFTKEGLFDSAVSYYEKSLKINEEINHEEGIAIARHNIGTAYFSMKNYKEALNYFLTTHEHFEKTKDKLKIAESFNKIGDVQFKLGNFNEALANYTKSIEYASEANAREQLKNGYHDMSDLYESRKDYKSANKYLRLYNEVKDSLLNEKTSRNIAEMEEKYESEKKSKEIELLKRDTELSELVKERQLIIIIALVAFVVVFLYASLKYYKKNQENIIITKKLEKTIKQLDTKSSKLQEANRKLTELNDKLYASESNLKKLNATKDKFFSIIAHDLRSPINTLNSYIMYLLENGPDMNDEEMNELLNDLTNHFNRVDKLLENLLNWSYSQFKDSRLNKENFDLNELILKNYALYEGQIKEKNIGIRYRLSERGTVNADKNMIDVVIRNLLSNSVRYNNENGRIEFETVNENERIKCVVRDSGIGMTEDQINNLFDIAKSTETRNTERGGTGLGLVICKEFIDRNDGELKISSTPGKGTELTFYLPAKI